jgi:hypothetical protein
MALSWRSTKPRRSCGVGRSFHHLTFHLDQPARAGQPNSCEKSRLIPLPLGFTVTRLVTPDGVRLSWHKHGVALSRAEALLTLRDSPAAGESFGAALASLGFDGMYWECAVIGPSTLRSEFECVALRADHFGHCTADRHAFADQFAKARPDDQVVYFPSLGGASRLVAPLPLGDMNAYGHIASFVKRAPPSQVSAFFALLSAQALRRAQTKPVWISTAGDAVAWLHGRLDNRPKYYQFKPYIAAFSGASSVER